MKARRTRKGAGWLLALFIIPFVVMLWPPFYNFTDPPFIGIPFFYWFQLAWIFVTAILTGVVYLAGPKESQNGRAST
jgi:polyferredoxin